RGRTADARGGRRPLLRRAAGGAARGRRERGRGGGMSADGTRVALVTGGSRGLGAAIVRTLAGRGLRVAFTYRERADLAEELCDALAEGGAERPLALRF